MKNKSEFFKIAIIALLKLISFFALVFLLAGKIDYWQGWVFIVFNIVMALILMALFRDKLDLAKERMHPGPGVKWWDKIILALFAVFIFGTMIIGILDSARFFWTEPLPIYMYVIGYLLYSLSAALVTWPMYVNKFFSSMVRIQKDRGQTVIQEGPYKIVRHPGYTSTIIMGPSVALTLGSLYALIPGFLSIILMIVRTYLEDETLKKELKGYKEYTKKVKYRLIPGVW